MNKAQLDQLLDNKEDFCKWQPETRQALRELADQYDREVPPESVSTSDVVNACLEAHRSAISPGTLQSYGDTWRAFARRSPTLPVTPEGIEAYLARYSNRRTARDVHTKLGILYNFASKRFGVLNAIKDVKKPRFKATEKPPLTLEQFGAVLNTCRGDTERALIELYGGHGLRLTEALRINAGDISSDQLYVRGKVREEFMPLLPETRELLLKLADGKKPNQRLFTIATRTASARVKHILARAGLGNDYSAHTLRHTFSTLGQEHGMAFTACQRLLRHSKRTETERYTHLSKDYLREQLERYSPLRLLNPSEKQHKTEY